MPAQAPQWTEYLSCPLCNNDFECNVRCPVSLGCGHTMCKNCLLKLQQKQCPFDQTIINTDINLLPENYAILQLIDGNIPDEQPSLVPLVSDDDLKHYVKARKHIEDLALYMKTSSVSTPRSSPLSRPMQKKVVALINCQLAEEEGRIRGMRAARSVGERSVIELILQHQNPQQLSVNLWAAVRARGCQFLGPAMQEEILKLVLLALEDGSALSRKVLVMFVVQRLSSNFPQSSKTSIGHVVQLLYRASCFKVSKRDGDSSLMQLKDEFRTYESLRREHDSQIVQIASEAGLRIAPEQWSSLLYGDAIHKSHMQSIIDKLQTPQSFSLSIQELVIALQRTGDPGNLSVLRPYLELLAGIDPSLEAPPPLWKDLIQAQEATRIAVKGLVDFIQNFGSRKMQEDRISLNVKYKTSMCRDFTQRATCPRGANCTFAHSQEELEKFRAKTKKSSGNKHSAVNMKKRNSENSSLKQKTSLSPDSVLPAVSAITNHIPSKILKSKCKVDIHGFDSLNAESMPSDLIVSAVPPSNVVFEKMEITPECPTTSSIPYSESDQTPFTVNSENPLFQTIASKSSKVMFPEPQYQATKSKILRTNNYDSLPATVLSTIPTATRCLPANLKRNNNSVSSQQLKKSTSANCHERKFSAMPCVQSINDMINTIQRKENDAAECYKSIFKKQNIECQKLSALQQKKKQLLAQLDKTNLNKTCVLTSEKCLSEVKPSFCLLKKTFEDGELVPLYSPWTSRSILSCESPTNCTKSNFASTVMGSCNLEEKKDLVKKDHINCSLFCPSEKDEFIPFDPPLASKYGPISRCSKSSICGQPPIRVNALSQMGDFTNSTSVVCHPLSSASLAPSYTKKSSSFAVPVKLVPKQYVPEVESASVMVPVAVDHDVCPNVDDNVLSNRKYFGSKDMKINQEQLNDSLHNLQSAAQYAASSYRPSCNSKTGDIVPTSIGPWPSETLENLLINYSKAEYETKVRQEINDIEQQWLEVFQQEEQDVWMAENG